MTWLIVGLLLWAAAHLFNRIMPKHRAALGKKGKAAIALLILISIGLMIFGYGAAEYVHLFALPIWAWYINNLLMLIAIFMIDVGRVNGVIRTKVRHPMLLSVVIWSTAHLLVNGDLASLVLFGGLGFWALVETAAINRAEGPWQVPAEGTFVSDGKVAVFATAIYAVIVGIHYWLGYSVIVFL